MPSGRYGKKNIRCEKIIRKTVKMMTAILTDYIQNKAENTVHELYKYKLYAQKQADAFKRFLQNNGEENTQTDECIDSLWHGCSDLIDIIYETAMTLLIRKKYCQIFLIPVGQLAVLLVNMKKYEKNKDIDSMLKDYVTILKINMNFQINVPDQNEEDCCCQNIFDLIETVINVVCQIIRDAKDILIALYEWLISGGLQESNDSSERHPTF